MFWEETGVRCLSSYQSSKLFLISIPYCTLCAQRLQNVQPSPQERLQCGCTGDGGVQREPGLHPDEPCVAAAPPFWPLRLWGFRVASFFSVSVATATFGCSCFCASWLVPPPFTLLSKNCGISCSLILTFLLSLFFWVFLFFCYEKARRKKMSGVSHA